MAPMRKRAVHKQRNERYLIIAHGLAISLALCGLYLIVVESLDWAVYGTILFGLAFALEIVVGVHCEEPRTKSRSASRWKVANVGPIKHRRRV